ncbi:quinoprotein dehydrogenase-associated putative ABC transporter substrate-binding protein [Candidimonas sp. SYP-B2681]|nr:quinoprotein dehydrogenase-associated putative ABC transporter substrate-binding protein [Candidimonas sp. SYP-B2681]
MTYRTTVALLVSLLASSAQAQTTSASGPEQQVLRVCQDPNNLPMSDRQEHGYENKIAELFAKKLGWKLEHAWWPQRMGFIRNTLQAKIPDTDTYKCDVVTSVSPNFEMGLATKPYLTSTYAMAYVKGKGLDSIHVPEDVLKLDQTTRKKLRIGIFTGTPAADWLIKNDLSDLMVSYQLQTGDPDQYPGQIIENDLATGKLDIAIAWGPIVGYFAKRTNGVPIEVVPFQFRNDGIQYGFGIAMGVRHGQRQLRDQLNALIDSSQPEIRAILEEYSVPIVSTPPATKS